MTPILPPPSRNTRRNDSLHFLLLALILVLGAYFRLVGLNWDEGLYLHPDERFLYMVQSSIEPIQSFGEYFDTAVSSLNPNNRGHGFFVYGTLPIFLVRYLAEWVGVTGYGNIHMVGRPLSALVDIGSVLLVYLVARRLYDRRVALLAAAFTSFAVLHIQLSHFYKEDTFMTFFTFLALYFAVRVATGGRMLGLRGEAGEAGLAGEDNQESEAEVDSPDQQRVREAVSIGFRDQWFDFLFFGIALGMAVASKLNAGLVAVLLPLAVILRMARLRPQDQARALPQAFAYLVFAAAASLLTFRILQPYAFQGPGFLDWRLNPSWLDNLRSLRAQASPESIYSFPPGLQWAERPIWFSWVNMVLWGFGAPLGVLAWTGFLWAGWRMVKGSWQRHLVLWAWAALYFGWQSSLFNPTMRYLLPVYPAFAIFAGWAVVQVWDYRPDDTRLGRLATSFPWQRSLALVLGSVTLAGALGWSYAFTRIYTRPVSRVEASRWIFQNVPGSINLHIQTDQGQVQQPLSYPADLVISPEQPYIAAFSPRASGELDRVSVFHARDSNGVGGMGTIQVLIADNPERNPPLGQGSVSVALEASQEGQGQAYSLVLDPPVEVAQDSTYYLQIDFIPQGAAAASFSGAALANETSWDDGLPLRVDGLDPYGGIYQGGLNLEMYWPDSEEKAERFVTTLDQADYLLITSSRQWGSIGRLPDRYPLSTTYYRSLLGCPVERSLEWCYNVAQPGMFQGELGYELERVFASNPNLGNLQINDQPAEEAFTVYDHPKVFIFRKTATLETQELAELFQGALAAAGTSDQQAGRVRQVQKTLLLPPQRLEAQREGGTWSALFNAQGLVNRSPYLSVLAWYLSLGGVGLVAYPIVRAAFPGLRDHGYPASRMVGLLLLAYFPWLAGSVEIPFSRLTIAICGLGLALVSALFAYRQRESLRSEWRHERRYLLVVEGLFLAFFLVGLLIRLGNPDLWHPWKGGEKPMDFSYFNAVLKSSTFPPYDPWYAGGYINYYYYGFVLVGVLVKALGIEPAVAYNLILPTLFALIGMGAFSFGWNLIAPRRLGGDRSEPAENGVGRATGEGQAYIVGLSGSLGMVVLGNLGTLRMIFRGYQSLAAPGADLDALGFLSRMFYAAQGFFKALAGTPLPYALADWYWNPSRAIQPDTGNPITEFPFFTFLYADLHAHLIALPLTLLVLLWGLSVVRSRARWSGWIAGGLGLFLGGLAIGALRPTNTWDFYPYLLLGVLALAYGYLRRALDPGPEGERDKPLRLRLVVPALVAVLLLVGLAHLLYQPFSEWYVQGYTQVDFWPGGRTPTGDYLTHWGVFLFVIVGWMAWETRQWMASTPLSALAKLAPYRGLIYAALAMLLVWTAVLLWQGVHIAWLVLPVAVWAGILLFRPGMPSRRRVVLFMTGTALALTLMVEVIVLQGDIGRMNTVFKFYLQAWTLFALSAAGALGWLVSDLPAWSPEWRRPWQVALSLLVAAAALYPLLGGLAKVKDRMAVEAPHTLDGMEYMAYATYQDLGTALDLSEDYRAIRWLQENVQGSPVIVEANSLNLYHWFSRMTINTGLPGVVGWDWHQRQQRAFVETSDVTGRVYEVEQFYNTEDLDWARAFLERFEVEYIVVGQLEKASYAGPGLEKFPAFDGIYWRQEYQNGETAIYRVIGELALGAQP